MVKKKTIWGIIGCGDVAEVKSGPAFQQIKGSKLKAVMRRNATKARNFAERHDVPYWYDKAEMIIKDPEIDALYIATPPSTHLSLATRSLAAGKNVYLEKPMTLNVEEAHTLQQVASATNQKITIAHYRRQLPAFLKVKELIDSRSIGDLRFCNIEILQPQKSKIIADTDESWRTDPAISGGGYFYDLAPHQLDLMRLYFGPWKQVLGFASNQSKKYEANDIVHGSIDFENGMQFRGIWAFNVHPSSSKDECIIYGSKGNIKFSFYGENVHLETDAGSTAFNFQNPVHIQMPMIEKTVQYFQGETNINPCSVDEGLEVMKCMEQLALG